MSVAAAAAMLSLAALVPAADVQASLQPVEVTVGERVSVEVIVPLPEQGALPRLEPLPRRWGEAEILDLDGPRRVLGDGGTARVRWRLDVAAFRPGAVELPPLALAMRRDGRTTNLTVPSLSFTVRSVLPDDPRPEIRPPAPLRRLPVGKPFWTTSGLLAVLSVAAGAALSRRRDRAPRDGAAPEAADLQTTLTRLEERVARGEDLDAAHRALSMALRRHLERRLHLPAPRRTTPEIAELLPAARWRGGVVRLLQTCDRVAFGAAGATGEEFGRRLDAARRLGQGVDRCVETGDDAVETEGAGEDET